jgi:hypothetical protein
MDWIAGNNLYKSSPYTRQQQQSTIHDCKTYPMLDIFLSYFHVYSHKIYIRYVKHSMLLKQVYLEIFLVVVCSLASYFSVVYFHVYQFIWDEEGGEKKPEKLFEKLEGYCNPRTNEVLESHRFWNVQYQEPFDNFM